MKKYFLFLFLFLTATLFSQDRVIAELGFDKIYESEFVERFEMNPMIKGTKEIDSLKKEFLYTLIAEKLWARKSLVTGLANSNYVINSLKSLERLFTKDLLYRKEILDKIQITKDEIDKGVKQSSKELRVKYIYAPTKDDINKINSEINFQKYSDTTGFLKRKYLDHIEEIPVNYGQMKKEHEDILYNLSVHEYSTPVKTSDGWVIFYISDIIDKVLPSPSELEKRYTDVKTIIENRKEAKFQSKFYDKYILGKNVKAEISLYKPLVEKIESFIQNKKDNLTVTNENKLILSYENIIHIKNQFAKKELSKPYLKFQNNPLNFKEFFDELSFWGLEVKNPYSEKEIIQSLNFFTKNFIQSELIYREGIKLGLNKNKEVTNSLKMWRDSYSSKLLMHQFVDSAKISDKNAEYLRSNQSKNSPDLYVNIQEILTDNLDTVAVILEKINQDIPFDELAAKYNQRTTTIDSNGEYGLMPLSENGQLGKIAFEMEVGEVYGPVQTPEGYSIIKLKEKVDKESNPEKIAKIELKKIKDNAFTRNLDYLYNRKTAEYAKNVEIKIDHDLLNQTEVTNINVFVHRKIGFGGKISAVPILTPLYKWYNQYLNEKRLNP